VWITGSNLHFSQISFTRLIGTSSPDSGTTTYGYRAEGTLVWRIDARGIRTDYATDLLYRPLQASYPAVGELGAYTVNYRITGSNLHFSLF